MTVYSGTGTAYHAPREHAGRTCWRGCRGPSRHKLFWCRRCKMPIIRSLCFLSRRWPLTPHCRSRCGDPSTVHALRALERPADRERTHIWADSASVLPSRDGSTLCATRTR